MCFHPKSNLTIPLMTNEDLVKVIEKWAEETKELTKKYCHVQVFENKGAMMGCSNPHPHCQIWASSFIPNEPALADRNQREYLATHGKNMLVEYAEMETKSGERT